LNITCWLLDFQPRPRSRRRLADTSRSVVEQSQGVHGGGPTQIGDLQRLRQHGIAEPAAQHFGGEIDLHANLTLLGECVVPEL